MIADLDTLLIALYVELTDRIIPRLRPRRGPGRRPEVTDAEVVCLAVAQVLLRYNDEHHWLRAAPSRVGHLFPRLLSQSEYNRRLRSAVDLMEAALRWLAAATPTTTELLRLTDGTPVVWPLADHGQAVGPGGLGWLRPRLRFPLECGHPETGHRSREGVLVARTIKVQPGVQA